MEKKCNKNKNKNKIKKKKEKTNKKGECKKNDLLIIRCMSA